MLKKIEQDLERLQNARTISSVEFSDTHIVQILKLDNTVQVYGNYKVSKVYHYPIHKTNNLYAALEGWNLIPTYISVEPINSY